MSRGGRGMLRGPRRRKNTEGKKDEYRGRGLEIGAKKGTEIR